MEKIKKSLKDINIEDLKRPELREKIISIRTTKTISKWMAKNKISPSKIFNEAIEVIMK